MKRFFIATLVVIGIVGFGWRYAPQDIRAKALEFVGRADRTDIVQGAKDVILPENPAKRRTALTDGLKQKISEIKQQIERKNDQQTTVSATAHAIEEAEQLLQQLEQISSEQSIGGRVVQRVLDAIVPVKQCKE